MSYKVNGKDLSENYKKKKNKYKISVGVYENWFISKFLNIIYIYYLNMIFKSWIN